MAVAIIGYSGHAYVVLDAALETGIDVVYYCERVIQPINPFGLKYLGNEYAGDFEWHKIDSVVLGIGDNLIRKKVAKHFRINNKDVLTVVHPSAKISKIAKIGLGSYVGPGVVINALAVIGESCILNTSCIVEHECVIQSNVHVAPGAVLAGNVFVGDCTFIGANSVIKQGITIGRNVVVGAGSVVLQDIPDNEVWVGNPAKKR